MSTDLQEALMRVVNERNQRNDEREFQQFCQYLLSLPADLELRPKDNFKADIELQPLRWMNLGIELLRSRRVTGHVQLANGVQGREIGGYLRYPIFQMGTEIFLKGMWLCQFADCRQLNHSSYVDEAKRNKYRESLRNLTHDLLRIIDALGQIPQYACSESAMRFLHLVEELIRAFYFPPYEADQRSRWTDSRYPKRVYDDVTRQARAESCQSFPRAEWIERIFRTMEADADRIWQLRAGLSRKSVMF